MRNQHTPNYQHLLLFVSKNAGQEWKEKEIKKELPASLSSSVAIIYQKSDAKI